jgi:PAS domain S-box-containing protein
MAVILVIDDHPENREPMRALLEYQGHRVAEACGGEEGLEKARAERPDLIICDIGMQRMDGYEVVQRLRGDPVLADTKVVFNTATYLYDEAVPLARACSVSHLITRPGEPQEILKTVEAALSEVAATKPPTPNSEFDRERLRLLTDKLIQKVVELEDANHLLIKEAAQRRQAEAQMRLQSAALEAAVNAIVITDCNGYIIWVNPAFSKLTGYSSADAIGQTPRLLKSGAHDQGFYQKLWNTILGGNVWSGEMINRRKDGTHYTEEQSITPVRNEDGNISHFISIKRDISERKEAEQALRARDIAEAANRMKSEFLANMSHELRTPLNAIIGFSQMMHDGKLGPVSDQQKEYLGDVLAASAHLLQLINDVLDLSKVEAGKAELVPELVKPSAIAAEVQAILQALALRKRIEVQTEVDPSLPEVVADARGLKQVLYNYLSNAIKFTGEDGRIAVRIRPEPPDRYRIEVEDNGIGIRAEDIGKLFSEFQQLDAGKSKKYQGTGLGLALTKRLVEAHGGYVGVASKPGEGSVFYAVLPVRYGLPSGA